MTDLNTAQQAAVTAPPGPTLVLAGAGSGKTRVVARRIAWRIENGAEPESILAVTFTNKAARELRDRVEQAWVGTFHSIGLRLLRLFGAEMGLPEGFAVLGEDDAKTLIQRIRRELRVDPELITPRKMRSGLSEMKCAVAAGREIRRPRGPEDRAVRSVFEAYQDELARTGAADFDDLIIQPLALLRKSPAARDFARRRAEILHVDEYQDTSPLQYQMVEELCPGHDVFAVGDDDQSIYSFRGADFENILRFERDFPGARVFRLEENYRSSGTILCAANAVISKNRRRHGKELRAVAGLGRPITLSVFAAETGEAHFAAAEAARLGADRGEAAVLLRTRAQTRAYEEAFAAHRVPHRVIGGLRFYERKEVLDARAHVQLAVLPENDVAFRRAVGSLSRGVGDASLKSIEKRAAADGSSLLAASEALVGERGLARGAVRGLRAFLEGIERVRAAVESGPAKAAEAAVEATGLGPHYERQDPERLENLVSLKSGAADFARLNESATTLEWLDQVSLLSAEDFIGDEGDPPVLVMTVHAAKGLEFDTVFLGGLWEGVFPHSLGLDNMEEERRLFYVGITRARSALYLLAAPGRSPWRREKDAPSRFLAEIPRELFANAKGRPAAAGGRFRRGMSVRHARFGVGRIESADPDGSRVTVLFRHHGRRRLVVAYARLEPA